MMLLVEPEWLSARLNDKSVRIFDCTTHMIAQPVGPSKIESGWPEFSAEHIPGSQHLDMVQDLSDPDAPYPFGMLTPIQFQALMRRFGVKATDHIVLYGRSALTTITRAWLVFYVNGHQKVSILNGGFKGWSDAGYPVAATDTATDTEVEPTDYLVATQRPEAITDIHAVRECVNEQTHQLINALSPEQFKGTGGANYGRVGRIPNSSNLPARHLFDLKTQRFKPIEEIRQQWKAAGLEPSDQTIHYCGGGIAASTTAFVQTLLGYDNWAVYDHSLLEWCHQSDTPMVTD